MAKYLCNNSEVIIHNGGIRATCAIKDPRACPLGKMPMDLDEKCMADSPFPLKVKRTDVSTLKEK